MMHVNYIELEQTTPGQPPMSIPITSIGSVSPVSGGAEINIQYEGKFSVDFKFPMLYPEVPQVTDYKSFVDWLDQNATSDLTRSLLPFIGRDVQVVFLSDNVGNDVQDPGTIIAVGQNCLLLSPDKVDAPKAYLDIIPFSAIGYVRIKNP